MREMGELIVALSGGVDSAVLLALAVEALGRERVLAVTGVSDALAAEELEDARRVARHLGVTHRTVRTFEMQRAGYVANEGDRCYHCRTELFVVLEELGREVGTATLAYGAISDDLADVRPGMTAARERGVRAPLLEAGLAKDEVREIAAERGIPVHEKPASPCLASRIPAGSVVTPEKLEQIAKAERGMRELGFRVFRVRHHGELARIEVAAGELEHLLAAETRAEVVRIVQGAGFRFVALDLAGYRVGGAGVVATGLHRIGPARDGGQ